MIFLLKFVILVMWLAFTIRWAIRPVKGEHDQAKITPSLTRLVTCVVLLVAIFSVMQTVGIVDSGYRGVVVRLGRVTDRILPEGLYLVTPFVESVKQMSVQTEVDTKVAKASSKDLQEVTTEVALNYALMENCVNTVYRNLRWDYSTKIIDPAIQEAVKAATAQYEAERLITQRSDVKALISSILTERLNTHCISIDAISITDFQFSKVFNDAIEAKVTATQEALKAQNETVKVQAIADQRVATAEGEAKAIRAQMESLTRQGGAEYVALKWVEKWNGQAPQMMMTGSGAGSSILFQMPNISPRAN